MAKLSLLAVLTFLVYAEASSSVNLILKDGAFGSPVVDAAVTRITQTCMFGDDKRFLRRLAYVETQDGNDAAEFNSGKNGGIWKIDHSMFNDLASSALNNLKGKILEEFEIDWATVTYADLGKPLYSGLAAAMYSALIISASDRILEIPRSIRDQSNFWADYMRPGAQASEYETKATEFEDSQTSCKAGADIVFLIDESGSIGRTDYITQKDFVAKVIENLVISPTSSQVGVITYGSYSTLDIKLNDYTDKEKLIHAVKDLAYAGGGTATHSALNRLTDEAFNTANGARPEGEGTPRVGIILTDGGSNNREMTQASAARAREAGILLFSIGVGRSVNVPELEGMASEPTCRYYFQLNGGFSEIYDLVASITATTCGVPIAFEPNGTLIKPVEGETPYNCEIPVSNKGASVVITSTKADVNFFLSRTTYPSEVFYDEKVNIKMGDTASIFIPPDESETESIVYCNIVSDKKDDLTIITQPGPITFNCQARRNPCTQKNIGAGKFYFPHDSPSKYVQCGGVGMCFDMSCPAGLVWDKDTLVCNWPSKPPVDPPSGYTCAKPNPCGQDNTAANGFYFPHVDPKKFIQCDAHGSCFEMPCGAGTEWNDAIKTCDHAP